MYGQIFLGYRDNAAFRAINDGYGRAPIALPRDAPVLDTVGDGLVAESVRIGKCGHLLSGFGARKSGPLAGVFDHAVIDEWLLHRGAVVECAIFRPDYRHDRDAVGPAEFEIALVVGRHGHDRARSIAHQDEIADPDGNSRPAEGMDSAASGWQAKLLDITRVLARGSVDHFLDLQPFRFVLNQEIHERMFLGQYQASRAVDGIDPCGKDANLLGKAVNREIDFSAFRTSNPVALHGQHAFRPAVLQFAHVIQQFRGVRGGF